jgi:single-stranded-DNA-specific exonuclease
VVPLTGENRIIVKEGMRCINNSGRAGIRALKDVCGLGSREIRAGILAFTVVPRINAAGRIADSRDVVRLLLSEDDGESQELSAWLDGLNAERQKIEERVYEQALAQVDASEIDSAVVLSGEGWHQGVLGIVASRIAEEFGRPAFIFSIDNGIAKGSARSIPSFDICKGLAVCEGLLLSFGGHKQAAGIRLKAENIPEFGKAMNEIIRHSIGKDGFLSSLEIDVDVSLSEVTHSLVKELTMLEPLGYGNPEPLFGARELEVVNPRIVGKNHLRMKLRKSSYSHDTIGFGMGAVFEDIDCPPRLDVIFTPGINEWNGSRYLQLVLKAMRPSP